MEQIAFGASDSRDDIKDSTLRFVWWDEKELSQLEDDIRHNEATGEAWVVVLRLFDRAWWARALVVQEALLAREVTYMCGHDTLGCTSLLTLFENIIIYEGGFFRFETQAKIN